MARQWGNQTLPRKPPLGHKSQPDGPSNPLPGLPTTRVAKEPGEETEDSLVFRDPPPARSGADPERAALDALRRHPNRWAVVRKFESHPSAGMRAHRLRGRYPEYEIVGRAGEIFARYVPKEKR
jgi:hypothetical protein